MRLAAAVSFLLLCPFFGCAALRRSSRGRRRFSRGLTHRHSTKVDGLLLNCRGGAGGEEVEEEASKPNAVMTLLMDLPPGVRYHVVGALAATALVSSGFVEDKVLQLDLVSTFFRFQVWRPLSAASFLGTPSMAWATSIYLLVKYGTELEREVGSTAYAKFLVVQVLCLVVLGSAIGLPFVANSLVTAIIYAASRLHPFADVTFQFGIKLKYWMLPFGLMLVEMLQANGSVAAVIPHVLGVLTAHFHHFFAVVWPRVSKELQQEQHNPKQKIRLKTSSSSSSKKNKKKQ